MLELKVTETVTEPVACRACVCMRTDIALSFYVATIGTGVDDSIKAQDSYVTLEASNLSLKNDCGVISRQKLRTGNTNSTWSNLERR